MTAYRALLVLACVSLSACAGNSRSLTALGGPTAAAQPSSGGIVLHVTPADLGCDSIGIDYRTMTFHIDAAAPEQVSALTDTGVTLTTYWPAGFTAGTAGERVVRDGAGTVVAVDGDVLQVGQQIHGYGVCLTTSNLHVVATP